MSDEPAVLRVAEAERDQARQALERHLRDKHAGKHAWCDGCRNACRDCRSLTGHVRRTEEQVALLTPASPEMEALFDA